MDPQEWAEAHAVQAVTMGPNYYAALWAVMDHDYAGAEGPDDTGDTDDPA